MLFPNPKEKNWTFVRVLGKHTFDGLKTGQAAVRPTSPRFCELSRPLRGVFLRMQQPWALRAAEESKELGRNPRGDFVFGQFFAWAAVKDVSHLAEISPRLHSSALLF
jgi:hypothetical protein